MGVIHWYSNTQPMGVIRWYSDTQTNEGRSLVLWYLNQWGSFIGILIPKPIGVIHWYSDTQTNGGCSLVFWYPNQWGLFIGTPMPSHGDIAWSLGMATGRVRARFFHTRTRPAGQDLWPGPDPFRVSGFFQGPGPAPAGPHGSRKPRLGIGPNSWPNQKKKILSPDLFLPFKLAYSK